MTPTPLSLDNAMKLATEAFLPYGCVTGANPEDDSFGFTVMSGSGEQMLQVARVPFGDYADPQRLAGVIAQARQDLEHSGCPLEPWSMPHLPDEAGIAETTPNH